MEHQQKAGVYFKSINKRIGVPWSELEDRESLIIADYSISEYLSAALPQNNKSNNTTNQLFENISAIDSKVFFQQ